MAMITENDIDYLFDELWPLMYDVTKYKMNCLDNLVQINNCFKKYPNHDELLGILRGFYLIDITIASGLIWSVNRDNRVPFDKYTMGFALEKRILRLENVTSNYVNYSDKIKDYCNTQPLIEGRKYEIEDFVRDAQSTNYPIKPK